MLLVVDIGNTNISFGIFRLNRIVKRFNIPTREYNQGKLREKIGRLDIKDAVICSVVPDTTVILARNLKKLLGKQPYIIGKDIIVPIKNRYRKPQQVGQDRLVNAYAGVKFFGAPLIVVDFGTAITFDVISRHKEYLGGLILPGLNLSLEALYENTALLPEIKLGQPQDLIGRDTKNSMLSGIIYGIAALTDDLAQRIKRKIGKTAQVIGTGGDIELIAGYCKCLKKIDKNLTLNGLSLIFCKKNCKKNS